MNVMVDIETMGTSPTGAIVSIGAVEFDEKKTGKSFYMTASLESNLKFLRTVDAHTIEWWMKQNDGVRSAVQNDGESISFVMGAFANFLDENLDKKGKIWANGVSFDIEILRHCYKEDIRIIKIPWSYRQECCMRSLRAIEHLYDVKKWHEFKDEAAHNALIDATKQAEYVLQFYNLQAK